MDYSLNDLLAKMGLNELTEQKSLRWHYTDSTNAALGGVAEARLDEDGRYLSVNLVHRLMEADMDTDGTEEERLETVQIEARRIGDSQTYRITKLGFDGTDFAADNDAMLQLGTGLFYARALHINEIMIEQRFKSSPSNLRNIYSAHSNPARFEDQRFDRMAHNDVSNNASAENLARVIIPFRQRKDVNCHQHA
jgi:hypothetical protein